MSVFDELSEAHVDNLRLGVVIQALLVENRRLCGVLADARAALVEHNRTVPLDFDAHPALRRLVGAPGSDAAAAGHEPGCEDAL